VAIATARRCRLRQPRESDKMKKPKKSKITYLRKQFGFFKNDMDSFGENCERLEGWLDDKLLPLVWRFN
jgi:hypothetical protein